MPVRLGRLIFRVVVRLEDIVPQVCVVVQKAGLLVVIIAGVNRDSYCGRLL